MFFFILCSSKLCSEVTIAYLLLKFRLVHLSQQKKNQLSFNKCLKNSHLNSEWKWARKSWELCKLESLQRVKKKQLSSYFCVASELNVQLHNRLSWFCFRNINKLFHIVHQFTNAGENVGLLNGTSMIYCFSCNGKLVFIERK